MLYIYMCYTGWWIQPLVSWDCHFKNKKCSNHQPVIVLVGALLPLSLL